MVTTLFLDVGVASAMLPDRANSSYGQRSMRSTVTMLKYLARAGSESELNSVLQQNARCEGTLAERRRRAGKLRGEQEQLQEQLQSRVTLLANSLQADANAKAAARSNAAADTRRRQKMAEQAARVMGAVAPHRASAQAASLSVVAPRDWQPLSPPRSPMRLSEQQRPESPKSPGSDRKAHLALKPGRYCLRSYTTDSDSLEDETFVVLSARGGLGLGNAERAGGAPWLVRQPAGSHACTFSSAAGALLWGSLAGEVSVGEPPKADLSHFLVMPYRPEEPAIGLAAGETGPTGHKMSPRPFSSQSPRVSASIHSNLAQRPQTALAASGGGGGGTSADDVRLMVRLYHPASRRFLHIDPATGAASLQPAKIEPEPSSKGGGSRAAARGKLRPPTSQLSVTFELLLRHARDAPRPGTSARAATAAAPPMRVMPVEAAPINVAGGGGASLLSSRPSTRGGAASGRPVAPALAARGFDMATGVSTRPNFGRGDLFESLRAEGLLPAGLTAAELDGFDGTLPPWAMPSMGLEEGFGASVPMPQAPRVSIAAPSAASAAAARQASARGGKPADDAKRSAWEPSQLDLSDVMAQGPLLLSSLFASPPSFGAGMPVRQVERAQPPLAQPPYAQPPLAAPPLAAAMMAPAPHYSEAHYSPTGRGGSFAASARPRGAQPRFQTRTPAPNLRGLP